MLRSGTTASMAPSFTTASICSSAWAHNSSRRRGSRAAVGPPQNLSRCLKRRGLQQPSSPCLQSSASWCATLRMSALSADFGTVHSRFRISTRSLISSGEPLGGATVSNAAASFLFNALLSPETRGARFMACSEPGRLAQPHGAFPLCEASHTPLLWLSFPFSHSALLLCCCLALLCPCTSGMKAAPRRWTSSQWQGLPWSS
jgi:hypothetical protein